MVQNSVTYSMDDPL